MPKLYISFYSDYNEESLLFKLQQSLDDHPPIPRIGEKVVIGGTVYKVNDIVNYFEREHEVAILVQAADQKPGVTLDQLSKRDLPKAKRNKAKERPSIERSKILEKGSKRSEPETPKAEVLPEPSGPTPGGDE